MGLTLITGPAQSGKTSAALERLAGYSPVDLAQKVRYVVPTKESARQVESRLIRRLGAECLLGNVVCTFFSLTSEIVAREGLASSLISDEKKELTLRKLVQDSAPKYLGASAEFPGFIGALDQIIGELKLSLVKPEELALALTEVRSRLPAGSYNKLTELAELYERYQDEALRDRGLHDREGLMWRALELAAETVLGYELVVFDGFGDFNAVQRRFLKILVEQGCDVVWVLDYEAGREEVFQANGTLRDYAVFLGAEEVVCSVDKSRHLCDLRQDLFRGSGSAQAPNDRLTVIEGCDPMMEVELVAEEILRMVALGRCDWNDILVTSRDLGSYQGRVDDIFSAVGIPLHVGKRPLVESTLTRTLLTCLRVVREDWPRDEVLRLLKSDLITEDNLTACRVEIAAKSRGIVGGRRSWLEPWRADDETLAFRGEALAPIIDFHREIWASKSLSAMTEAVRKLLQRFEWRTADGSGMAEDAASRLRIERLLTELEESAAFIDIDRPLMFFGYLEELIRLCDYELPRPPLEGVTLAPANNLGGREYRVVFILGLLEKVFPRPPREEAFIRDWERELLNGPLGDSLSTKLNGAPEKERFLFYRAIAVARERLYLCYPLTNSEAKDSLPSFYLDEVERVVTPKRIRRDHASLIPAPGEVFGVAAVERAAVFSLARGAAPTVARVYNDLAARKPGLFQDVWRRSPERQAELSDARILEEFVNRTRPWSCSELENYAGCPFRYFVEYVLGLTEIRDEVDPLDTGKLLHDILNRLFVELRAEHGDDLAVDRLDFKETVSRAHALLEEFLSKQSRLALMPQYEQETLAHDIQKILSRHLGHEIEQAQDGFTPTFFELGFGRTGRASDGDPESTERPFVIEAETGSIEIAGRIDRVDTIRSGGDNRLGAHVIDYKSGSQDNLAKYIDGTKLQPLIYAAAVEQLFGLAPWGAEYRPLRAWRPSGFYGDELAPALEESRQIVIDLVGRISAGLIGVEPLDCPRYCRLHGICRHEKGPASGF